MVGTACLTYLWDEASASLPQLLAVRPELCVPYFLFCFSALFTGLGILFVDQKLPPCDCGKEKKTKTKAHTSPNLGPTHSTLPPKRPLTFQGLHRGASPLHVNLYQI